MQEVESVWHAARILEYHFFARKQNCQMYDIQEIHFKKEFFRFNVFARD